MDIIGAFISGIMWCLKSLLKGIKWCAQRLWKLLRPSSRTFGRARWASNWNLWRAGLFKSHGLIIGKRRILFWDRFIRYADEGHATVIAPPRQGKGAYFIIPNLLDHPGSVIVTDPKGENYAITGKHREKFGPVFKINAIDPENSDQFNPLDTIRLNSPHTVDDAELIADLMVTPDVKADSHWDEKARMRLTGFILYVITARPPELRTLMEVRRVIMQDTHALEDTLQEMTHILVPQGQVPIFCKLLGQCQTILFGGRTAIFPGNVRRTLPIFTVFPFINMDFTAHHRVFQHDTSPFTVLPQKLRKTCVIVSGDISAVKSQRADKEKPLQNKVL